ncbi:hypothetical protein G6F43_014331 [Rhizopus delemar]|nr:hypothetical protein G6F43_014331 [Rhizopus delemar]
MKKPSSPSPSSGSAASQWNPRNQPSGLGRPCRSCGADNWRPGHRCKGKGRSTGSSVDDSDLAGPSHLFRGMSRSPASSGSMKDLPSIYYIYIYKPRVRSLVCLIW